MRKGGIGFVVVGLVLGLALVAHADVSFDDIQFWAGTGPNRAGLVIDWNDGADPQSLVWGYKWDGSATGEDMLLAIAGVTTITGASTSTVYGADPSLSAELTDWGWGKSLDRLAYDNGTFNHDESGWGWYYWVSTDGTSWTVSGGGMAGRTLTNGNWDGWSYEVGAPWPPSNHPSEPVPAPAPIPEPSALSLLALGGLALLRRRRS